MIGDTTLDGGYGAGLTLTSTDTANLRKAGKWGRFLGILSMVLIGLVILAFIGFGSTMIALMSGGQIGAGGIGTVMIGCYLLLLGFTFYLTYLLYKFGAEAVIAVDNGDGLAMTRSLASLGRLFKIYGIMTVIYLAFIGLSLLFALIGGGMAAFGGGSSF